MLVIGLCGLQWKIKEHEVVLLVLGIYYLHVLSIPFISVDL